MTDKKNVKKSIKRLQYVKTWQLVVVLILFGLLAATFLRLNNIGMVERRTAVLAADKANDEVALKNNLFALQRHASAHMNAGSGVVYLEYSYKRDVQKIVERARRASDVQDNVLNRADAICRAQFPGYSQAYVQCNATEQARIQGNNPGQGTANFPNPELYRHEYYSPAWSPDFAGWSLVICGLITLVIIARLLSLAILKALLHKHYSSI